MATTFDEEQRIYRSSLLTQAQSLQVLAEADERRAAWVRRCGGSAEDVAWHRERASRRRAKARDLMHRFDVACREPSSPS